MLRYSDDLSHRPVIYCRPEWRKDNDGANLTEFVQLYRNLREPGRGWQRLRMLCKKCFFDECILLRFHFHPSQIIVRRVGDRKRHSRHNGMTVSRIPSVVVEPCSAVHPSCRFCRGWQGHGAELSHREKSHSGWCRSRRAGEACEKASTKTLPVKRHPWNRFLHRSPDATSAELCTDRHKSSLRLLRLATAIVYEDFV